MVWVVLQPLLTALVFVLVFAKVAKLSTTGIKPIVFIFAGVMVWNLFSGIITRAQGSLVSNRDLVSKVFFPRMLVPLAVVYSCLVDFLVSMAFLVVLMVIFGVNPGLPVLLGPLWTVMFILLASGDRAGDIGADRPLPRCQLLRPVLPAVPAVCQPDRLPDPDVPSKYRIIYDLNPLTWLLQAFQWSFVRQPAPYPWEIAAAIVVPIVAFVAGAIIFEQMERGFADTI